MSPPSLLYFVGVFNLRYPHILPSDKTFLPPNIIAMVTSIALVLHLGYSYNSLHLLILIILPSHESSFGYLTQIHRIKTPLLASSYFSYQPLFTAR